MVGFSQAATREAHEAERELQRLGGMAGVARELVRLREDCHRWRAWTETMIQTYREQYPLRCVDLTKDVPGPYRYEYRVTDPVGWVVSGPVVFGDSEDLPLFRAGKEEFAQAVVAALNTIHFLEESRDGDEQ